MVAVMVTAAERAVDEALAWPGIRLFVGGDGTSVGRKRVLLDGDREFTAAHRPQRSVVDARAVCALLDSGAFTDKPHARLTPAQALARQLAWEQKAAETWDAPGWQASYLVSYDRLIDETWTADGTRHKRRWTVQAAEQAVSETVQAAAYLARQRARLWPRRLVLSCQGVDAGQYAMCVEAVLRYAAPVDVIGLGGWCILGRFTSWLPTFEATLWQIMPQIAAAGIQHVHIFGVMWRPALGRLLWIADQHGIAISTDSSAPILSARYLTDAARKKAGLRGHDWVSNLAWWQHELAGLRESRFYRAPARIPAVRQGYLWE